LNANIQNLGNADLTVNSINLCAGTSAEFSFTADPTPIVIPPGGTRMVSVAYAPVDEGLDTGCLDITSDDPDESVVFLDLSGNGTAPQTGIEAHVQTPGAVNGANRGRTPIQLGFDLNGMDHRRVKIAEVQCGAARDDEMPRLVDPVRVDRKLVALFNTHDLMLRCEDNKLVCEGTLADGSPFIGMDALNVVRDVDHNRCRANGRRVAR
jgi:hypothetical protein